MSLHWTQVNGLPAAWAPDLLQFGKSNVLINRLDALDAQINLAKACPMLAIGSMRKHATIACKVRLDLLVLNIGSQGRMHGYALTLE